MSLATDVHTLPFGPDYNVAVDDLFQDVIVHAITISKSLDLLKECNPLGTGSHRPSWVVGWNDLNYWKGWEDWKDRRYMHQEADVYNAARDQTAKAHEISISGNKLTVQGLLVDEIACLAKSSLQRVYLLERVRKGRRGRRRGRER